jgi:hypothetical protein
MTKHRRRDKQSNAGCHRERKSPDAGLGVKVARSRVLRQNSEGDEGARFQCASCRGHFSLFRRAIFSFDELT